MYITKLEDPTTPKIKDSLKQSLSYANVIKITNTLNQNIIWCICDIKNIKVDSKDQDNYNLYLKYLEDKNIKDYITEQGAFSGIEHDVAKLPTDMSLILNELITKYNIKLKHCENLIKIKCGEPIIDPKKFTNMCFNMFQLYTNKIKELEQKINELEIKIIDDTYVQNFDLSE